MIGSARFEGEYSLPETVSPVIINSPSIPSFIGFCSLRKRWQLACCSGHEEEGCDLVENEEEEHFEEYVGES